MAEQFDLKTPPGAAAFWDNFSSANKSMQTLAAEMQRVSKEQLESSTQLMEKLRGAKSFEDIVAVQTNFIQQSFTSYTETTRRFSELMMAMPMEFAKQSRAAFQQGTDAMTKATEQAGDQMRQAGEDFNKPHG